MNDRIQLISGVFEHSVLNCVLWFVWARIFQSNFPYTQHWMFKCSWNHAIVPIFHIGVPASPSFLSRALLPSPGGANISLQWSPSFTSQYAVERYHVSVNPDPSSCSSDQVSPSEDYSCSGLVLGTRYTFTVSAINCGDQEGEENRFNTFIEGKVEEEKEI